MVPAKATRSTLHRVRSFELITPAGRVHSFPRRTLPRRFLAWLWCHADTAAVSAAIFVLIYIAGVAAEAIEPFAADCGSEGRP